MAREINLHAARTPGTLKLIYGVVSDYYVKLIINSFQVSPSISLGHFSFLTISLRISGIKRFISVFRKDLSSGLPE